MILHSPKTDIYLRTKKIYEKTNYKKKKQKKAKQATVYQNAHIFLRHFSGRRSYKWISLETFHTEYQQRDMTCVCFLFVAPLTLVFSLKLNKRIDRQKYQIV